MLRGDYRSSSRQKRARTAGTRCVSLLASLRVQCVRVLRAEPSRAEPSRTEPSRSIGENVARTLARSLRQLAVSCTRHVARVTRSTCVPVLLLAVCWFAIHREQRCFRFPTNGGRTIAASSTRFSSLLFSSLLLFPSNSSGRAFSPSPPLASFVELVILVSSAAELNPN